LLGHSYQTKLLKTKMPAEAPVIERKVAIMGFRSVGKSSISIQFAEDRFPDTYDPTISNTFMRNFEFRGRRYRINLQDTAGQDEYSLFPRAIDVHGFILVYAINSRQSFDVVKAIYEKILDNFGNISASGGGSQMHIPVVLVGNKLDLQHIEREVPTAEGKQLAESMKAVFLETSAREHRQVHDIFDKIVFEIEKTHGNVKEQKDSSCVLS